MRRVLFFLLIVVLLLWGLAACAPAATPAAEAPSQELPAQPQPTAAVKPTSVPAAPFEQEAPSPAPSPITIPPVMETTPPLEEGRLVELEWPVSMQLGDSEVVRLALLPVVDGYVVRAEFPEHQVTSGEISIPRRDGYVLSASARLDGVGFDISPAGGVEQSLPFGRAVSWRWTAAARTAGKQGLVVSMTLHWRPQAGIGTAYDEVVFSRGLNVQVHSILGMDRPGALRAGISGLLLGGGMSLFALVVRPRRRGADLLSLAPNPGLRIENPARIQLAGMDADLLRALFHRYGRLSVQGEFLSGYSGARTLLCLPVRLDGNADAYTIVKIGQRSDIQREYENYEAHVKNTLPPITARIQQPPVTVRKSPRAALQYTFIAEPGRMPSSLRQELLEASNPQLITKLFETFGPNWWMQRRPYTFRMDTEFDLLLPPHYVLEPAEGDHGGAAWISENTLPETLSLQTGDLVRVGAFRRVEIRADGRSLTLRGLAEGKTPLRLRWLGLQPPRGSVGRVKADRAGLFGEYTAGMDRFGLPDPLPFLPKVMALSVMSTRSVIHGDLNLENILVGPGGFVWLIDFAQTRFGPPMFDFSRLAVEIITQVVARQINAAQDFPAVLDKGHGLLDAVESIAGRCLFNPFHPEEYHRAMFVACMGALKFSNLDSSSRHLLYLTAAYLVGKLGTIS